MKVPIRYKYGLHPARPGAVKMEVRMYRAPSPVDLSGTLGRYDIVTPWHILGNNEAGNCFWAGRAHELYLRSALKGNRAHVTTWDTFDDYHDCTGFVYGDEATDQGTDLQKGASYCRKIGIRDVADKRHKDGAYAAIQPGNLAELVAVAKEFGAAGVGLLVGDNQQEQFANNQPWSGPPGPNPGYHYVPVIDWFNSDLVCVTWGRWQLMTPSFFESQCDQALAYIPEEAMTPQMQDDLNQLTKGSAT